MCSFEILINNKHSSDITQFSTNWMNGINRNSSEYLVSVRQLRQSTVKKKKSMILRGWKPYLHYDWGQRNSRELSWIYDLQNVLLWSLITNNFYYLSIYLLIYPNCFSFISYYVLLFWRLFNGCFFLKYNTFAK